MLGYIILTFFAVSCLAQTIPGDGPCAGQEYGALIPDPTDCSWYYQCQSANTTRMPCPSDTHWWAEMKTCAYPLQAKCTPTPTVPIITTPITTPTLPCLTCPTTERSTTTTTGLPTIEAPCTSLDPETIGDPEDCSRYTYCYMGKPAIVKCAIGEFYSKPHNACIESAECPGDGEITGTTTPQVPVIIPPCSSLDAETIGFPDDCTKYTYCFNGMPHLVKCAIGEFYSAPHSACIKASECPATTTTTPTSPTTPSKPIITPPCDSLDPSTKDDPKDCTRYYFCENGIPHLVHCYPGMYYSKEHNGCITASECPAGNGGVTPPTVSSTLPPIQAPCTSLETETLEYPGDCTRYYYCKEGHPFIVKCALGQYYSKPDNACIHASECPANVKPTTTSPSTTTPTTTTPTTTTPTTTTPTTTTPTTTTPTTTTPTTTTPTTTTPSTTTPSTTTSTTTTTTTTTTENPIKPPCTSMEDETFPIPEDCTRYIYCYKGYPLTAQCQKDYYYSVVSKSCIAADRCPQ